MASNKALAAIALTLIIAVPILLGFALSSENVTYTEWEPESRVNLSDTILNSTYPIYMEYDGSSNNTTLTNGNMAYVTVSTTSSAYPMMTVASHSITFPANTWVDLSSYDYWEIRGSGTITYFKDGNDSAPHAITGDWLLSGNGGSLKFTTAHTFTLLEYADNGQYADINGGWKLPLANTYYTWTNNQQNNDIKILIDIPDNTTVSFGSSLQLKRTSGLVTVEAHATNPPYLLLETITLGYYQYVLVDLNTENDTFSGLTSWPAYGSDSQTFNTISLVDNPRHIAQNAQTVALRSSDANTVFRVESAEIASGSFPSTEDYTLNMNNLFPGKSYAVKLNSIGIYGSTLTVGTESFTVTNGRVTVDGSTVALKGVNISSRYNGSNYDIYLGGHLIGTSATPASITFGGQWSLTITGDILTQTTGERAEWYPGGFAFDKDSFVGVIVLAAALTFIGVGMYGARSGLKAGLLLMICGGAALIAITTL